MAGDRSLIAHLFRRAGFSARPAELTYYESRSYQAAVDALLSGKPVAGEHPSLLELDDPVNKPVMNLRGRVAVAALSEIQGTWLQRMVTASAPLVERMTLFLHNHFATAYRPGDTVDTPELQAQNDLFRTHALGNWKTLCHAIIEDVAMSNWLSNSVNVKAHPNENLAREFMELFTLGPGNYTETDVREAARALTGYQMTYNLTLTGPRNAMTFTPARHDDKPKTILGQTGNFMPHDFVDIALSQEAAPRFLARKLIQTFAMPDPSTSYVDRIANTLISSGWELKPALSDIFNSTEFMDARSAVVKSPAEFVAGSLRALGRTTSNDYTAGLTWMTKAGQTLFDPPNVGGWPHNMGWLGAGGVLARYNAASTLADLHIAAFALPGHKIRSTTPDGWADIFGITDLVPSTRNALAGYLADPATAKATDQVRDAAMITLVVASPDFSLA